MRQLCNVAFALQVESMDQREYQKFVRELELEPGEAQPSFGTGSLMAAMMGARET